MPQAYQAHVDQTESPRPTCKIIAFRHAGYNSETMSNTVMFRLKGSAHYGGAMCAKIVWMTLACLVEPEALGKIGVSRKRCDSVGDSGWDSDYQKWSRDRHHDRRRCYIQRDTEACPSSLAARDEGVPTSRSLPHYGSRRGGPRDDGFVRGMARSGPASESPTE
jgi:hypothetical protein